MAAANDMIGNVLEGKYRITRLLGKGGMGEVYAGTHIQLERPVAIKIMRNDFAENEGFVARFSREARATARIDHPNAVNVYDFGSTPDGHAFLVMEFIDGVSLREVLRRTGRFALPVAVDLIRQASAAVGAAHARGIVHRDIKPENMMVRTDESGAMLLKVVDFGLVKLLENETSQLTNQSELMGTPKYMAPEQFSGNTIDERVDVYALGCVFFELITGRAPFEGTFIEVVGKHVYTEPPTIAACGVPASAALELAVRRSLAKDPAERVPSAIEFARELAVAAGLNAAISPLESATMSFTKPDLTAETPASLVTHAVPLLSGNPADFVTRISANARPTGPADPATVVVPRESSPLEADTVPLIDGRITRPAALPTGLQAEPQGTIAMAMDADADQTVVRAARTNVVAPVREPRTVPLKPNVQPTGSRARLAAFGVAGVLAVGALAFWAVNGGIKPSQVPQSGNELNTTSGQEGNPAWSPNTNNQPAATSPEPEPPPANTAVEPGPVERPTTPPSPPVTDPKPTTPVPAPPRPPSTQPPPPVSVTPETPAVAPVNPDRRKLSPQELRELRRLMFEMERRKRAKDGPRPRP